MKVMSGLSILLLIHLLLILEADLPTATSVQEVTPSIPGQSSGSHEAGDGASASQSTEDTAPKEAETDTYARFIAGTASISGLYTVRKHILLDWAQEHSLEIDRNANKSVIADALYEFVSHPV